jgi:hypothetical protein
MVLSALWQEFLSEHSSHAVRNKYMATARRMKGNKFRSATK